MRKHQDYSPLDSHSGSCLDYIVFLDLSWSIDKVSFLNKTTFCSREVFLGNVLNEMMRNPTFEDPVNNARDLVERNITLATTSFLLKGRFLR